MWGKQRAWGLCCRPASFLNGELPCPIKDGQPWVKMAESGMVLYFSVLCENSCKEKRSGVREDVVSPAPARCGSRVCFDQRLAFLMRAAWDARQGAPFLVASEPGVANSAHQRRGQMIPTNWVICPWRTPTSYVPWDKPQTFLGLFLHSVVKILYVKPICAVVAINNPGIIMSDKTMM